MRKIFDITPEITETIGVWPGDTPFSRKIALSFKQGHHLELSSLHSTVHLGAHTDAPIHYHPKGQGMSERSLEPYFGPCQVVHVSVSRGERIRPEHCGHTAITTPRILFKTGTFPNPALWNTDFAALSPEVVLWLAKQGVTLIGIDTPSIDLFDDAHLLSHQAIFEKDLCVLEGIDLASVEEGTYELIALPLKLKNFDASPVRAILVQNPVIPVTQGNPETLL